MFVWRCQTLGHGRNCFLYSFAVRICHICIHCIIYPIFKTQKCIKWWYYRIWEIWIFSHFSTFQFNLIFPLYLLGNCRMEKARENFKYSEFWSEYIFQHFIKYLCLKIKYSCSKIVTMVTSVQLYLLCL